MLVSQAVQWWLAALWRTSWQSSLVFCVVFLIVTTLRKWLTPNWRLILWSLPLLRMLMIVVPTSSISVFGLLNTNQYLIVQSDVRHQLESKPTSEVDQAKSSDIANVGTGGPSKGNSSAAVEIANNTTTDFPLSSADLVSLESLSWTLFLLWLTGACLFAVRLLVNKRRIARIITNSWTAEGLLAKVVSIRSQRLGIRRPIRCLLTREPIGPATVGFFRPVILVPEDLASCLPYKSLVAVIEHELRHIEKCDACLLLLTQICRCLHWYNPIAYWCQSQIRQTIELAVDRSTIDTLGGANRRAYGELIIDIAGRSQGAVGLTQMANRKSLIKQRIGEIAVPTISTPLRSTMILALIAILAGTLLFDRATSQDTATPATSEPTSTVHLPHQLTDFLVTGVVTDQDTHLPIPDAEIQVLVPSESDINKRMLRDRTDASGRYRIHVPIGNVTIWLPRLKPGYWIADDKYNHVQVKTTVQNPIFECDIPAKSGPVWNLKWVGEFPVSWRHLQVHEVPDANLRQKAFTKESWSSQEPLISWHAVLPAEGVGAFTQVGSSGKLIISLGTATAEFIIDPAFDNTKVKSIQQDEANNTAELIDANGRIAKLRGATAVLDGDTPTIMMKPRDLKSTDVVVAGRIVDTQGRPVPTAPVGIVVKTPTSNYVHSEREGDTDSDGKFEFRMKLIGVDENDIANGFKMGVRVKVEGYAVTESPLVKLITGQQKIDISELALLEGYDLPIETLDAGGQPIAGHPISIRVNLMGNNPYEARTNEHGRAMIRDLPAGLFPFEVGYDGPTNVAIVKKKKNPLLKLTLKDSSTTAQPIARDRPKPLAVGQIAPAINCQAWSDGQTHSLGDYRGKLIVLEFWGTWCSPCINSIPAMQRLAEDYAGRGVVFLGVHTADGAIDQINRLRELKNWRTPSALDAGDSMLSSATAKAYGVHGYPTIVMIDGEGNIAFRSDIPPNDMAAHADQQRKLAEENGIAWPVPEDTPYDVLIEMSNKMIYSSFAKEINRLLATTE